MAILNSIGFQYNNEHSNKYHLMNIHTSAGLYEEPIGGARQIIEEIIDGRDKPYFKGIVNRPLEFNISFAFEKPLTDEEIRQAVRWLKPDNYRPLIFEEMPYKIFYCMPIESMRYIHNGLNEGYLNLTMRCNTYHAFSPAYVSPIYKVTNGKENFIFENKGDFDVRPLLYIKKIGNGSLTIKNYSDSGKILSFYNLLDQEELIIDNKEKTITSSTKMNRYYMAELGWLNLVYGQNNIEIEGNCEVYYKCQFPLY